MGVTRLLDCRPEVQRVSVCRGLFTRCTFAESWSAPWASLATTAILNQNLIWCNPSHFNSYGNTEGLHTIESHHSTIQTYLIFKRAFVIIFCDAKSLSINTAWNDPLKVSQGHSGCDPRTTLVILYNIGPTNIFHQTHGFWDIDIVTYTPAVTLKCP